MKKRIYLDNAATTPLAPEVLEAMLPYLQDLHGNPSSPHEEGRIVKVAIEKARKSIAEYLATSPSNIFFTSGGTESNNMALQGLVAQHNIRQVITSSLEHNSVGHTLQHLVKTSRIAPLQYVALQEEGMIDLNDLAQKIKACGQENVLVSLMHANNEIGNLTDMHAVNQLCAPSHVFWQSDTVQSVGKIPFSVEDYPHLCAFSLSAHKFHGPKGAGVLYWDAAQGAYPLLHGGKQERNMRAGTENVAGIIGTSKAFAMTQEHVSAHAAYIRTLKEHMLQLLTESGCPFTLNGQREESQSLPNVLHISLPADNFLLAQNVDIRGISLSTGSACNSGAQADSHVLQALGREGGHFRFSFSRYNTLKEIETAVSVFVEEVNNMLHKQQQQV